jgi:hypothetical protein
MQDFVREYISPGPISEQHVHVSWRAILAGIVVALAVDVLLTFLGLAVGLTAFEPTRGVLKGVGIGFGVWLILTAIASVFAGAYFGARVAGDPWRGDGVAHGLMVWAGFLLISLWLMGAGMGKVLNSAAGLATTAANTLASPDAQANAVSVLIELGYSPADAEQMVNQPRQAIPPGSGAARDPQSLESEMKQTADEMAARGAVASWVAFGSALLSLVGGALGGMLGAIGEERQVRRFARQRDEDRVAPSSTPAHPAG